MTLEEIHAIYDGAYVEFQKSPVGGWSAAAAERYALRRVVEALRDELSKCDWDEGENMIDALNEILASDGGEAKPVCPTCKGAGALFGPYDPSDRTPCPECTPDAAPDVCEWSYEKDRKYTRGNCGRSCYGAPMYERCLCGLPISFKSEAAR